MFPMRLKIGPSRNNEWRCCFCLHVRTATILLGTWHLILHVLALSVLALLMRNHHMSMQREEETSLEPGNILPTPLSKIKKDEEGPYYLPQDGRAIYATDMDMSALMTVCTLAITLLLVYGTVKGKATHLLPFFCLQLFDFAITTLTATGFFCYLRSGHQFVNEHWQNMPFRSELLQLSPQQLSLVVLVTFLLSMLWKAYCISIVWRCYKYLTLRQQAMRSTVHYILPGEGSERGPEPDYSTLLPDYEAACASAMKQAPPPSYQVAMEGQPPAYPEVTPTTATTLHTVNLATIREEYQPRFGFVIGQSDGEIVNIEIGQNNAEANNETTPESSQNTEEVPLTSATASPSTSSQDIESTIPEPRDMQNAPLPKINMENEQLETEVVNEEEAARIIRERGHPRQAAKLREEGARIGGAGTTGSAGNAGETENTEEVGIVNKN